MIQTIVGLYSIKFKNISQRKFLILRKTVSGMEDQYVQLRYFMNGDSINQHINNTILDLTTSGRISLKKFGQKLDYKGFQRNESPI